MDQRRYNKGLETLAAVMGSEGGPRHTQVTAPGLARYAVEAFGDLYGDTDALDLKTREIATVAALTAMGHTQPQLKAHIRGALNIGVTQGEIVAVITQMYAYAGFPAALNGISTAQEVFSELGNE